MNRIGSPPPTGSKNLVAKFRSKRSIVRAPARTGIAIINRRAVIAREIGNIGILCTHRCLCRILIAVEQKFRLAAIEEIPPRCSAKIAKSIEGSPKNSIEVKGG